MTASPKPVFCTYFDGGYLPQGLALLASLERHAPGHRLWVLALDDACHRLLSRLGHPALRVLALEEVHTPELREARANRSWGEYCWTLTPFLPEWVLERDPEAETVTYIDADCWLAGPVAPLLDRFEASGAACMITPHAYTPHRDRTATAGTYCVQFMPFRRGPEALEILRWWRERCLERCGGRPSGSAPARSCWISRGSPWPPGTSNGFGAGRPPPASSTSRGFGSTGWGAGW